MQSSGLLSWQPFSGYDLKKIIAESNVFYWSGNNNQIYRTLINLHEEGLVDVRLEQQDSLPARKIYTITTQGKEVLHKWLLSNPECAAQHKTFLIQLAWAELLSTAEIKSLLAVYQEEVESRLLLLQEKAKRRKDTPGRSEREAYLWQMIYQNEISALKNELIWQAQVRQGLAKFEDKA